MCAAFVGCSKSTEEVFEQNQAQIVDNLKNDYRLAFESKYGKIDSNQSWDFTSVSVTRAGETMTGVEIDYPGVNQTTLHNDKASLKKILVEGKTVTGATAEVKDWDPYVSVNMYPAFANDEENKNIYLRMVVNYNDAQATLSTVQLKNNAWWNNNGATCPSKEAYGVNTLGLKTAANVSWVIQLLNNNKKKILDTKTISKFKEVKVNGHTYWCFNFYGTRYTDLIFLVNERPVPCQKRYLVEDLGAIGDFDFNDIVVDVMQDDAGNQKAIIRAMGGTIDFTVKIGNTEWSKSVEGAALGYEVGTMYNTNPIDPTKSYDEFTVTGWKPNDNNIVVSAKVKDKTNTSGDVIVVFPFSRKGEVPMIIAVDTFVDWQLERSSLPEDWWKEGEEDPYPWDL